MLTKLKNAQQNWGGIHHAIDTWLDGRQEILVHYCKLANLPPFENDHRGLPKLEEIQEFCQLMVDYVSTGHFEIYDQLVSQLEKTNPEAAQKAQVLCPKISSTTDIALSFNDRYAELEQEDELLDLDEDLSKLGQLLELRFEYEDKLIQQLASVPA